MMNMMQYIDVDGKEVSMLNAAKSDQVIVVQDPLIIGHSILAEQLTHAGFDVQQAFGFQEGVSLVRYVRPHVIVLDWDNSTEVSLAFILSLKQNDLTKNIPIIFVTSIRNDHLAVSHLNAGADDYIIKPYSPDILVARIQCAIRRRITQKHIEDTINLNRLTINMSRREVMVQTNGEVTIIEMFPMELKLLYVLVKTPDKVCSRESIVSELCGDNYAIESRTIDVYIKRLRKAFEGTGLDNAIRTVRGIGYSFSTVKMS